MIGGSITTRAHIGPPVVVGAGKVNRPVRYNLVTRKTRPSRSKHVGPPAVIGAGIVFRPVQRVFTRRVSPTSSRAGSVATSNVSTPVQTNTTTDPYIGWVRVRRRV